VPGPAFRCQWTPQRRFDTDRAVKYSGGRWQRIRRTWLMQHPACNRCGLAGEEVHHIVPRAIAPLRWDDYSNLETLCHRCHMAHHHA
jgi:5-methylcytosine-specific restriction endonuclease McrA